MTAQRVRESPNPGALLHEERQVLELIATGAPLADTLDALCRAIDTHTGLWSSVYLLDRAGHQLSLAAGPHLPAAWRDATRTLPATSADSACGAAVDRRAQVIVPDVGGSPLFERMREVAGRSGVASAWSTPFFSKNGSVLGTFAVLSRRTGHPSPADLGLVARATDLATVAVERHLAEIELREGELRFSTAFYANPAWMTITRFSDGRFLYANDAFLRVTGYSRAETIGQTALGLGLYADPDQRSVLMTLLEQGQLHQVEAKARTRSGETRDLVISMERIALLGEESVLQIALDITDRKQAEEALRRSEQLLRLVLEAIPVGVIVVDPGGGVMHSNSAAERIWGGAVIIGGPARYAASKGWWHDSGRRITPDEWASVRARTQGEASINQVLDIETFDGRRKVIQNSAVPIRDEHHAILGAVVVNEDITAQKAAESALAASVTQMRTLASRLIQVQDDERRRIAQVLHETTAQDLAALKMLLARLGRTCAGMSDADRSLLAETVDLAERSMTGVRTLSYLLHPPFLDENGLLSAVRWYAEGFAGRSGIAVALDLPPTLDRLSQDAETAMFRVVQEALINIHRHAHSSTAGITLRTSDDRLTLEVKDCGHGMSSDMLSSVVTGAGAPGVGIAGMRERLEQLGGTLEITSDERGTTIRAIVPLRIRPT